MKAQILDSNLNSSRKSIYTSSNRVPSLAKVSLSCGISRLVLLSLILPVRNDEKPVLHLNQNLTGQRWMEVVNRKWQQEYQKTKSTTVTMSSKTVKHSKAWKTFQSYLLHSYKKLLLDGLSRSEELIAQLLEEPEAFFLKLKQGSSLELPPLWDTKPVAVNIWTCLGFWLSHVRYLTFIKASSLCGEVWKEVLLNS